MKDAQGKAATGRRRGLAPIPKAYIVAAIGMVALAAVFWWGYPSNQPATTGSLNQRIAATSDLAGRYAFRTGEPSPGKVAPPIHLQSTDGSSFDLRGLRGKTVLLYFQEGLTCQSCWDQNRDIARRFGEFRALGIDTIVTITTDPVDLLKQKATDTGIATPVLSDPDLAVSKAYHANDYGMMGTSRDGHTFIVVGPDDRIKWRADYGGAPAYTMYVPIDALIADLRRGLRQVN
ncbi:peroxiredoxin [Cupriavidus metallidurans]